MCVLEGSARCISQIKQYEIKADSNIIKYSLEKACSEYGTIEQTNKNDGEKVEEYLKSVGLNKGCSWCAAFVYWCFKEVCSYYQDPPIKKSGHCLTIWNDIQERGTRKIVNPKPNNIIIWSRGGNNGHIGRILEVKNNILITIEGNVEKDGKQGVWIKERNWKGFMSRFYVKGFVSFTY